MRPLMIASLVAASCALTWVALAEVKGNFIGPGTYATADGCKKVAALAQGKERNVETVPETLTKDGFQGWEGSCTFRSITEVEKGAKWKAAMDCQEGAEEGPESDLFERLDDGSLKVTVMGNHTIFVRCDAEKGK
ncbi:MAG: hypothetical protein AB7S74_01770 [Hyphomicrobium sp.]